MPVSGFRNKNFGLFLVAYVRGRAMQGAYESRAAEEMLKDSLEQFRLIIDTLPILLAYLDSEQRYLYVNQAYADWYGVSKEELVGKRASEVLPEESFRGPAKHIEAVLKGQQVSFDNIAYDPTGRLRAVRATYIPHLDQDGRTRAFLALIEDITQQVQAEAALRESEEKYRRISQNMPIVAYSALPEDFNTNLLMSGRAKELTGYSAREFLDEPDLWSTICHPQDRAHVLERIREHRQNKTSLDIEYRILTRDQSVKWVREKAIPALDDQGRLVRIDGFLEDITERKEAEDQRDAALLALKGYTDQLEVAVGERTQELRDIQEQLIRQEKLAVLGQLAGGVGHELRTPLGAIRNAAYFLNMALEEPDPEVGEMLEILDREVENSERIITGLLDFARAKPPARRAMDVNEVLQEALARVAVPARVEIERQLQDTLPVIRADPDQLVQVFRNLIQNAVQAMPDGGRLTVRTEAKRGDFGDRSHQVTVSVTDTGVGVPRQNLEKLFEPLFTTKPKGIGLGLALVKALVEGHGGSIQVRSQEGKGATFRVVLPVG
jgi:PAS domain S-box-containing protein